YNLEASPIAEARPFRFSGLRYIGMTLECYLLCELENSLVVVDMHAAHERVNFNVIRNSMSGQQLVSQQLLVPITVPVSEDELAQFEESRALLEKLGIEAEPLDNSSLVVRAVPHRFKGMDVVKVVKEVLLEEDLLDGATAAKRKIDSMAARLACHASVRSGDAITREEVYALFQSLDDTELSAACPHGRPVVVTFEAREVEAWFGRDR
ncbi:MAG: hypothetical protein KDD62_08445, partial [Bdellovibrionales bacterium]|nr:hypothetical protein [Bdellovibrionales bacterium]